MQDGESRCGRADLGSAPDAFPVFTLFFAVYGSALQVPAQYADFLEQAGVEVMDTLRRAQGSAVDSGLATRRATIIMATIRGLLLDLLSSQDPAGVHEAAEYSFDALEHRDQ